MPANLLVYRSLDQDELTVGDRIRLFGIIDSFGREPKRQPGEHQRQHNLLPEAAQLLVGHHREQIRLVLTCRPVGRAEHIGGGDRVGIHEAQPIPPGCCYPLHQGVRLARPARRQVDTM